MNLAQACLQLKAGNTDTKSDKILSHTNSIRTVHLGLSQKFPVNWEKRQSCQLNTANDQQFSSEADLLRSWQAYEPVVFHSTQALKVDQENAKACEKRHSQNSCGVKSGKSQSTMFVLTMGHFQLLALGQVFSYAFLRDPLGARGALNDLPND